MKTNADQTKTQKQVTLKRKVTLREKTSQPDTMKNNESTSNVYVNKRDRYAENAIAKASEKYNVQKIDPNKVRYSVATAGRIDSMSTGVTLSQCVSDIINILNRADKGKAPHVLEAIESAGLKVSDIKALVKGYATGYTCLAQKTFGQFINSKGLFDTNRALGALVAELRKALKNEDTK